MHVVVAMALDDWFHARPVVVPETLAPVVGTVAVTAGCLGALAGVCLPRAIALVAEVPLWSVLRAPPLHAYLLAWATFHMLEFVVTAFWNVTHLQSDCAWAQRDLTQPFCCRTGQHMQRRMR